MSDTIQGGKTPQEIEALKNKHGKVFLVEVENPNTNLVEYFWFKKPDMRVLSAAATFADQPFKMGVILFDNLLIEGDETVKNDVDVFPTLVGLLAETIKTAKGTIKEF